MAMANERFTKGRLITIKYARICNRAILPGEGWPINHREGVMFLLKYPPTCTNYRQVPVYRRLWFVWCTLVLCAPATILIAATGDIYARKGGVAHRVSDDTAWNLILGAFVMLILAAVRIAQL
jgi:hypothetical protein